MFYHIWKQLFFDLNQSKKKNGKIWRYTQKTEICFLLEICWKSCSKKEASSKINWNNESLNLCDIWRIWSPPKKMLHITSESGFWFHSKKAKLFFCFQHTSRFCPENIRFYIFSTDHSLILFLIWKRKWVCSWKTIMKV